MSEFLHIKIAIQFDNRNHHQESACQLVFSHKTSQCSNNILEIKCPIYLLGHTNMPTGTCANQNKKKEPLEERIPRRHKPVVQ